MQRTRSRRVSLAVRCAALLSILMVVGAGLLRAEETALDQLRTRFNRDRGVLRLVVLVSPTCPECVGGAEWIQDYVLKRYPDLPIQVYAVWYAMYPGDSPDDFPAAKKLMPDRRVTHWWDQSKDVGRWFTAAVPINLKGDIQWDAFYLYGEEATWKDQQPAPLLAWGRTILKDRKTLAEKIRAIAGPPTLPVIDLTGELSAPSPSP